MMRFFFSFNFAIFVRRHYIVNALWKRTAFPHRHVFEELPDVPTGAYVNFIHRDDAESPNPHRHVSVQSIVSQRRLPYREVTHVPETKLESFQVFLEFFSNFLSCR
jgi:type VI protein secretion system component VasA